MTLAFLPLESGTMKIEIPSGTLGLIFDCDGTIADTMPLHYEAWVAALGKHASDFPEALFYEMGGIPTFKIIEILNDRHQWNINVAEATKHKESLYEKLIHRVEPIEPVVQVIRDYAGKLPMAVATGGTRAICTQTLRSMNLLEYFSELVTADDVEHGKPAPDIFLEAARRIDVPPAKCCAFEDAELGLQSARAAGMLVIDVRKYGK